MLRIIFLSIALWSLPLVVSGASHEGGRCPKLHQSAAIQGQFHSLQHAASWIPAKQEKELKKILVANDAVLKEFSCFFNKGSDPNLLSDNLSALKLQILNLRLAAFKKEDLQVTESLTSLRAMIESYAQQPSMVARRLGASVRSLYLDELERLLEAYPLLVKEEVLRGYGEPNVSAAVEKEILAEWEALKDQWPASPKAQVLAKRFGNRPFRGIGSSAQRSRSQLLKLIDRLKEDSVESLESQLLSLFKDNPVNLDLDASEKVVKHYLTLSVQELRKNNYFDLKPWLDPVIDQRVKELKSELGVSERLVFPLVGVSLEGTFAELDQPVELLEPKLLIQARTHYARVKNPMGRLYELVFLKRLTQVWSSADIIQARTDLNRLSFLKTLLAVHDYEKRFARWPSSIDELVTKKLIPDLPKDSFTGQSLRYDQRRRQIWSVGENGVDEKGSGDDLSLSLAL